MYRTVFGLLSLLVMIAPVSAQSNSDLKPVFEQFTSLYTQQLGSKQRCLAGGYQEFRVCSVVLRNEGNAPYILHHEKVTQQAVVLFHGLSDSPFYLRSIAESLHRAGMNVVVALLPGHGLVQADADMQDPALSQRWEETVDAVMDLSRPLGDQIVIGGFSTGAALATQYALLNPENVTGLVMFSGALALSENAEQMSRIWGMQTIAKWIDGDYITQGRNPYKYPDLALFSVLELMEIIRDVRELYAEGVDLPTFAAHSAVDVSTPFSGIEDFLAHNTANNVQLMIDESYGLCHGNLPLNKEQVEQINFVVPQDQVVDACLAPKANPLHGHMIAMLLNFIQQLSSEQQR
jgi:pimeloyl-ACP methyl ester carboxylesterase